MSHKRNVEKLSVGHLKAKLEKIWQKHEKLCQTQMAPLLYHLRLKLKAQGKSGAGFGAWVEDTLDISRRTADRWADDWAISQGLKKASKRLKKTFRQMSKSVGGETADGRVVVTFQMALTQNENKAWLTALRVLGPTAQKVVLDAVLNAVHAPKEPAMSATEADRKRFTFLDDQPDTLLGAMEESTTISEAVRQ